MNIETTPKNVGLPSNAKLRVLSHFVPLAALVNVTLGILLLMRGVSFLGALIAVVLPLGALALIYVMLRDGGFRASSGVISVHENAHRYWFTLSTVAVVYFAATSLLAALLLRLLA